MADELTDAALNEQVARARGEVEDSPPREHYHEQSVLYALWQPLQRLHEGRAPAFVARDQIPRWSTNIGDALRDLWSALRAAGWGYSAEPSCMTFPELGYLQNPSGERSYFETWEHLARLLTEAWVEMKKEEKGERAMKLSQLIAVWDILHKNDTGAMGFCDLDSALTACGIEVENDICPEQPSDIRRRVIREAHWWGRDCSGHPSGSAREADA